MQPKRRSGIVLRETAAETSAVRVATSETIRMALVISLGPDIVAAAEFVQNDKTEARLRRVVALDALLQQCGYVWLLSDSNGPAALGVENERATVYLSGQLPEVTVAKLLQSIYWETSTISNIRTVVRHFYRASSRTLKDGKFSSM